MSEADRARERRPDGRPEQARPRDRTGRPLAPGTTGILLAEDHEPADVEQALALGVRLWNAERYFEAHECLEHVWHAAPAEDRDLWQGVIQVAVAGVHLQRGNAYGAQTLLGRAAERLDSYPDRRHGIDVARVRRFCRAARRAVIAEGLEAGVRIPDFPAVGSGPVVASDEPRSGRASTPLAPRPHQVLGGPPDTGRPSSGAPS